MILAQAAAGLVTVDAGQVTVQQDQANALAVLLHGRHGRYAVLDNQRVIPQLSEL